MSQVTRIAWARGLNAGKYAQLQEQARRLGRVRSEVWRRYGSESGAQLSDRAVRDRDADHAAAINILHRASDPGITPYTPHTRVRQILQERADRHRARLPAQDSSPAIPQPGGERTIQKPTRNSA